MTLSDEFKKAEDQGRRAGTKDDRDTAAPRSSTEDPNLSDFSLDDNEDPHFQDASETVRRATKQSETDDRIKHLESAMLQITGMLETLVTAQAQARSDDVNQTLKTIQTKPEVTTPTTQTKSEEKTPTETTRTNSVTRRVGDYKSLLRLVAPYDGSSGESLLTYIETFERYLDSAEGCVDYLPKDAFNLAIGHLPAYLRLGDGHCTGISRPAIRERLRGLV